MNRLAHKIGNRLFKVVQTHIVSHSHKTPNWTYASLTLCRNIFIAGSVVWTYSLNQDMSPLSTALPTVESIRISLTVHWYISRQNCYWLQSFLIKYLQIHIRKAEKFSASGYVVKVIHASKVCSWEFCIH